MSIVLSSQDIVKGKKGKKNAVGNAFVQPLQFIPFEDKDDDWCNSNLDFLEFQGLKQIYQKAPHFAKNYNLAAGIIDRSDYFGSNPETNDLVLSLGSVPEESHMNIEFYPFIPNFVNTLCTEFSERVNKIVVTAIDDYSYNEMLELKRSEVESVLLKQAEQKLYSKLLDSGKNPQNPEDAEVFQQQLAPENLKTLPEIESFFTKNYTSMVEKWANHQHKSDYYRFGMAEMEKKNFRNSLITDSAYFHYLMMEDDYSIEEWNPMFTFIFKSPETKYASLAYAGGNVKLLTIADIIDKYGYIMTQDQLENLERIYPASNVNASITGYDPQSYYDNTISHSDNVNGPSVAMSQVLSMVDGSVGGPTDTLNDLMNQNQFSNGRYLGRVTTMYWKSQRKVGHLTKIKRSGEVVIEIVDESYEVTDLPIYNNTLIKNRNPQTLIFGEHIEWTYINQVWGGVKIGPNVPSYSGMPTVTATNGLQPIYLGINQNKVGPVKYQFKGDENLYGCKLPIEGAEFSDYNARSSCPVDLLKPWQIGYNVVNNQIKDILVDELGTIVALDANQLPQESLGESWGKGNYAKAYVAMKNFNVLPLDRRLANTEGASGGQPLQQLDLSQTQRLLSRIQLATYFKNEGLSLMGITPQRLGQATGRQTATGVEENLNASYAQTEEYFTQFSIELMPRVYQMLLDLSQYYQSTKPSLRLQFMTSKEERVNFQINGTSLLLRDFNLYATSTASNRNTIEELRNLLITNNTAGGTIYQLGNLLTADSIGEINSILKDIETKEESKRREEYGQEQQLEKQRQEATQQERRLELDHEAQEAEKDRRSQILIAEIRAAGYSGSVDLDANGQNDYLDNLKVIQGQEQFQQTMTFEREKQSTKLKLDQDKIEIQREKNATQLRAKEIELNIARENQTKSELQKRQKEIERAKQQTKKK